jgi:xanthine dehydrogenase YagR molybdenum-binding subunit
MSTTKKNTTLNVIGKPEDRVDGHRKVTGTAQYSGEFSHPRLCYGVVIQSTVPRGRIKSIDTVNAIRINGVIAIYHHLNKPMEVTSAAADHNLFLLQNDEIKYAGQVIGLVVADTLENATYAASAVEVTYDTKPGNTNVDDNLKSTVAAPNESDFKRGNVAGGLKNAAVKIEETYTIPAEVHNPMEPFATMAVWDGDYLTLYESTQGVFATRKTVADVLGIGEDKVRVISHFVGGGFGSKLSVWSPAMLAAMAARKLDRPVRVVLNRRQMFGPVGYRPSTVQTVTLGANKDGTLTAIRHKGISQTCTFNDFVEGVTSGSRMMYACPNVETSQRLVRLDLGKPTWMRAPGHAPGSFALESALDELAYKLNIDPIELRLRNFAEKDAESGLPWSSNSLRQCYKLGAQHFGWNKRNPKPGSHKDGGLLVGTGMATALHTVWRNSASAQIRLQKDGTALVQAGTQDIGTGTYTIMTQIAAEKLSLPIEKVKFELGDTLLPTTPLSGGSTTALSVGPAVALAAGAVISKLIKTAVADKSSPLFGAKASDIEAGAGKLYIKDAPDKSESYEAIVSRTKSGYVEAKADSKPKNEDTKYSMSTFGAQFAEVKIDPDLGTVHVSRFFGAYGAGKILNAKTARSQMLGGITFGIGMALMEQMVVDHNLGRIINNDLAEYHVPVHADIGDIDTMFVEEDDPHVNILGAKGVGELGITGVAAAIANAVYHATGKRVRDLPITLDKLL